jgi:RNA-directed DNA polymerase
MSLTTPSSVQKLQTALHAKAKESPNLRFHALYDKVYRKDVLAYAYERCQANGGAAGVDNQTFENIEAYSRERWLDELTQGLKSRTYQPQPVRRVYIPKPDGKQRPLGIPTIRDRVVQTAAVLVLEPIFEADLTAEQYAYRTDRSALDAVQHVHKLLNTGHGQIVDADLSSYFDRIPHAELMKSVARRVVDGAMLHLIKMWLEAPVEETGERGNKRRSTRNRDEGRGTPQGSPISPLLSNLYMRRFVLGWKKLGHEKRWKAYIVNYADDLVICCRVGAEQALAEMRMMMSKLKLTVNEKKTRVCYLPEEKFDFLGYTFRAMLLDEEKPGLCGHGSFPETGAAHLSRNQRRNRARYRQAGSEGDGGKAQPDVDRLGQLLLSGSGQQSLQCGRSTRPPQAASVALRQT